MNKIMVGVAFWCATLLICCNALGAMNKSLLKQRFCQKLQTVQLVLKTIIDEMALSGVERAMESMTTHVREYPECINMTFGKEAGLPIQYVIYKYRASGDLLMQIVDHLISLGADYQCRYVDGATLTHIAVVVNNVHLVRYLITKYPESINMQTSDVGLTPLMIACSLGYDDIVDTLIAADVDLRIVDHKQRSAVHYAGGLACGFNPPGRDWSRVEKRERRKHMLASLLKAGLPFDQIDSLGNMPLDYILDDDLTEFFWDQVASIALCESPGSASMSFGALLDLQVELQMLSLGDDLV